MRLWFRKPRNHHHTRFIELDTHACQACWRCCEVCPTQVMGKVSLPFHKHVVFRMGDDCVGCGQCVAVCEAGALRRRPVGAASSPRNAKEGSDWQHQATAISGSGDPALR